eukprot:NODE_5036_length_1817_cov_3.069822.p1 GENE.NODE_5036_length_1817_cov_3.069822~~NODE_5036_length_1817_cov_3.069822.p1  ORF type:complete len:492 (+),score=161.93 NODE_5036_length_1817_cov_3.069822:60-1535(+)
MEALLATAKEPACAGSFFTSLSLGAVDGGRLSESMTVLGLAAMPHVNRYPYTSLWDVSLKVAARLKEVPLDSAQLGLPEELHAGLCSFGVKAIDFFFLVADVSKLLAVKPKRGLSYLNLVPHAWCYPNIAPGGRIGYGTPWHAGLFAHEGAGIRPFAPRVDAAFQCLSPTAVHLHSQPGGMCCSPNNGRFIIEEGCVLACFWSVCVDGTTAAPPRACATLHWLFASPAPAAFDVAIDAATTLQEFFEAAPATLGVAGERCMSAARVAFCAAAPSSLPPLLSAPRPSERSDVQQRAYGVAASGGRASSSSGCHRGAAAGRGRKSAATNAGEAGAGVGADAGTSYDGSCGVAGGGSEGIGADGGVATARSKDSGEGGREVGGGASASAEGTGGSGDGRGGDSGSCGAAGRDGRECGGEGDGGVGSCESRGSGSGAGDGGSAACAAGDGSGGEAIGADCGESATAGVGAGGGGRGDGGGGCDGGDEGGGGGEDE